MVMRLVTGTVGAVIGAIIGAIAWAAISSATGFQIGYVAVGVGFLAGYGMRTLGGGRDRADGIVAGGRRTLRLHARQPAGGRRR